MEVSGILAVLLLVAGGLAYLWSDVRGTRLAVGATSLLLAVALVAVLPVSLFHEVRVRRARRVENAIPEAMGKLAGFNERGIGVLQSFQILGRSTTGPLAREFRAVDRDVGWNANLRAALRRLRERVNTVRMTKIAVLLERASGATGNLKEVLDVAAADATRTQNLRNRRRQAMFTYTIVIYVVFAVFLYILYMVADLFYGSGGFGAAAAAAQGGSGLGSGGIPAETARLYFFYGALIQGACAGLVAGRLGEGYHLSGLKHAAILVAAAWALFRFGVLS
jgi:flagellar protein FlaJ